MYGFLAMRILWIVQAQNFGFDVKLISVLGFWGTLAFTVFKHDK